MSGHFRHAMPYGAELQGDGSTRFRLWTPDVEEVALTGRKHLRTVRAAVARIHIPRPTGEE